MQWQVLIGIGGMGLLVSLVMKCLPLHTDVDKNWGLKENRSGKTLEMEETSHGGM